MKCHTLSYTRTHTDTQKDTHTDTHTYTKTQTQIHTQMHADIHTYTERYTQRCTHTHTHIHRYTCMWVPIINSLAFSTDKVQGPLSIPPGQGLALYTWSPAAYSSLTTNALAELTRHPVRNYSKCVSRVQGRRQ